MVQLGAAIVPPQRQLHLHFYRLRKFLRKAAVSGRIAIVPVVLLGSACDSGLTVSEEPRMGGTLSLRAYDGVRLPADLGSLPGRNGGQSDCHMFVENGFLNLDPDYGVFDLAFEVVNCEGLVLSRHDATGVYWIEESGWRFRVPAIADGASDDFVFDGTLKGESLVVTGYAEPLEFTGAFVRHVPRPRTVGGSDKPFGAVYSLIAKQPTDCANGFLLLEPDYRVFELGVQPCGGSRTKWFGIYGQSGDRLEFLTPAIEERGQDILFSGRIAGSEVHVADLTGDVLVFAETGIISQW